MSASNQFKANQKKIFEPDTLEELLRGWILHAHKARDRHDEAARQNDQYHRALGVPTIVLSAIVGTSIFTSLEMQVDPSLKILVGLISITATVLASLQTFYNFADRADKHRIAGVKYKEMIRELEQLLTQPKEMLAKPIGQESKLAWLNDIRERFDTLEEEAPVVSSRIYTRIEKQYTDVAFVKQATQLY